MRVPKYLFGFRTVARWSFCLWTYGWLCCRSAYAATNMRFRGIALTPTHHVQWIRVNGCQCIRGRQRRLDEAGDKTPIAAGFLR
jgi:hypothetical protein